MGLPIVDLALFVVATAFPAIFVIVVPEGIVVDLMTTCLGCLATAVTAFDKIEEPLATVRIWPVDPFADFAVIVMVLAIEVDDFGLTCVILGIGVSVVRSMMTNDADGMGFTCIAPLVAVVVE